MRRSVSGWCAAIAIAGALAWAPLARADGTTSEALLEEGRKAMAAGDFERACPALARAVALGGAQPIRELLALGECHEKAGRSASAFAAYQRARALAAPATDADARARADAAITRLEPTLGRVRIIVAPAVGGLAGVSVMRGVELVENDAWGVAVPVDPGRLTIRVEAPGKQPFTRELEVAGDGEVREVRVDALADLPPKSEGAVPSANGNPLAEPIDDPRWGRLGTAGAVIGGVGLAALTVSLGLALKASRDEDDALADPAFACGRGGCNEAGTEAVENAQYLGDVATATALIGGTLTAAGLTMVIIELAAPIVKQQSITVSAGPSGLTIAGSF